MPPASRTTRKAASRSTRRTAKKTTRKPAKRSGARTMSAAHKRALAEGRVNSAIVDQYLSAMNAPKRRGRRVSKATLEQRLVAARSRVRTATGVEKLLAAQEVRDLQAKLKQANTTSAVDVKSLEAAFVKIAKKFGENRGVSYGAWRDAGVPAVVLKPFGPAFRYLRGSECRPGRAN